MAIRVVPQKQLPEGLQAVPTDATDLCAKNAWIFQIVLSNTTTGTLTVTIADKADTPLNLINAYPVDPNLPIVIPFPEGVKMNGGINWVASGAGLVAEVFGYVAG